MRVYVAGHELTHWVVAKLFLRSTGGLRLGKSQGSVQVERPNVWIVLAPYFLPIYMVLWIVLVKIASYWIPDRKLFLPLYLGIGVTYAYHVVTTILALSRNQSDLKIYGNVCSACLIILMNIIVLFAGLSFFSGDLKSSLQLLYNSYESQWHFIRRVL